MGARGERPAFIQAEVSWDRGGQILAIPGVERAPGGFRCTWDAAWAVAALCGVEPPIPPLLDSAAQAAAIHQMPGLPRYHELGLNKKLRGYQKQDVAQLALWEWGILGNPMRSGKTPTSLAASVLVGAEKTLVICPALPKLGWAHEIAAWTDEEAVILYGRAGKVARVFCKTCMGRGFIKETGERCPDCMLLNGQSNGLRLIDATHGTCTKHKVTCPMCLKELHEAIDKAKYVIVNYELLVAQQAKDGMGRKFFRQDLPGWVPHLARYKFDLCIADESHLLRGWNSDVSRKGQTRREKFVQMTEQIGRVWLVSGTPQYSYMKDWWGQMDAASKGAVTSRNENRLPFDFHVRYCGGEKRQYGWWADGCSQYAETEWKKRTKYFVIKRPRSEILKDMPPKQRQVIRIEAEQNSTAAKRILRGKLNVSGKTKKLMALTAKAKLPHVIENAMPELLDGQRIMVVCFNPDTAKLYAAAFEKEVKKREYRKRMQSVDARVWVADGTVSVDARFNMGKAFREHTGAGVFIMTIDAFQVGVSLKGAVTEHWVDVHHDPAAMLQAEDRAYEPGITHGLTIIYYVVKGTIDEHRESIVLPKVDALARVTGEEGAAELRATLGVEEEKETLSQTLSRLAAHIDCSEDEDDED